MFLQLSDVTLYYEEMGQGEPLILLHGNGESHAIFTQAIAVLKHHYKVYAIDTRGHGKSTGGKELHYTDMARDVKEFITSLQIKKPMLYGFSDGGIVALLLAIQYPSLLSSIVISGANMTPKGLKPLWRLGFKIMYCLTKSPQLLLMLTEPNIPEEMLHSIDLPVHITVGSRDIIGRRHTKHMADQIKNGTLWVFRGETHGSYVVNSDKIAHYILSLNKEGPSNNAGLPPGI